MKKISLLISSGGAELPPEPSAPVFETIPGYENVGGEQGGMH